MAMIARSPQVVELIRRLDEAVGPPDPHGICQNVKRVLSELVGRRESFLEGPFLAPAPDRYARRLLHRDHEGRYTVVIMVWDRGQGTPLHDHAGMWCVECVYRGRIRVTSFDLEGDAEVGPVQFTPESVVLAGVGEAGHLIPPFEYHQIENPDETPAVTIHVYGGEMTWCHAFFPVEGGGYRREHRSLTYTD
ncbi:MAG TPA: cysteine dioxygenase family protein [Candidatus Eisenbacteria bacterium]|jgi:predicted metal-dependent enzyme (double-stranded beta helix superfamily)